MYGRTDHAKQFLAKSRVGSTFKAVERNDGGKLISHVSLAMYFSM